MTTPTSRGAQIAARLLRRGRSSGRRIQHHGEGEPLLQRERCVLPFAPEARSFATQARRRQQEQATQHVEEGSQPIWQQTQPANPAMSFPCLDAQEKKTERLQQRSTESGPEPSYTTGAHQKFTSNEALLTDWGGMLPSLSIAYETWGELNADASNAILLHTGLSASSHAHSTKTNTKPGWWEKFIGPGAQFPINTNKYYVICTNVLGGCYGSTGPSSLDPSDDKHYGTRFPILTLDDMVRAQARLLDHMGISKLYASVGSSMGGMLSLAFGVHFPERTGRIVTISGCARSHPYSIAMRHTQRQALMMDPRWNRGFYYDSVPPHMGMKLARQIATVTYRSGPEWENRFGRRRADSEKAPALCPDFLIETYLDHAGEKFSLEYDPNSLLYISKAMDMFDLGKEHQDAMRQRRKQNEDRLRHAPSRVAQAEDLSCSLTLPTKNYEEKDSVAPMDQDLSSAHTSRKAPQDLVNGLRPLASHPVLIMGVASDILFPSWQQQEIADTLRAGGNERVTHVELSEDVSLFGHDTFLLDLKNIGGNLGRFLNANEADLSGSSSVLFRA